MAKKKSLLNQVKSLPNGSSGRRTWFQQMRHTSPDRYEELMELVNDFLDGGDARRVFISTRQLHQYLTGCHTTHKLSPPLITVCEASFNYFMERVRAERADG